ncbi:MAG: hypothetical protein ACYTG2_02640 [Planctomycetota bacterium]
MLMKRGWLTGALCVAVALTGATACGDKAEVGSTDDSAAAELGEAATDMKDAAGEVASAAADAGGAVGAAMLAVLEKADAADGTTDKVVSNCVTCGLGMKGSADSVAKVGDYELHLCSDKCLGHFNENPETALTSLKLE